MTSLDKAITGEQGLRFEIPFCDVFNLRRAMGIVAGAVADLDHVTRSRQLTARQIWL
jgi:hypothetical protein